MKTLFTVAALAEAATGMILLVYPPIVTRLLFNQTVAGAGDFMSRIAGVALIALGVACWPDDGSLRGFYGLFSYSALVMLLLIVVGAGGAAGILLWPAVVAHAGLCILLIALRRRQPGSQEASTR